MPTVDLHLGDCLEYMRTLPDGCVDAVITDPPYNVSYDYSDYGDNRPDYEHWCAGWLAECRRVTTGPVAISCGTKNLAMWCRISEPHWVLCWWKPACMGNSPVGACNWEPVLLYGKPKRRTSCDVVRATIKPQRDLDGHPCPKPLEWGVGFVNLLTLENNTILDPFMGSGTTGVACVQTGRSFIGCEIDAGYFAIAKKRIRDAQAQPRLFTEQREPLATQGGLL